MNQIRCNEPNILEYFNLYTPIWHIRTKNHSIFSNIWQIQKKINSQPHSNK